MWVQSSVSAYVVRRAGGKKSGRRNCVSSARVVARHGTESPVERAMNATRETVDPKQGGEMLYEVFMEEGPCSKRVEKHPAHTSWVNRAWDPLALETALWAVTASGPKNSPRGLRAEQRHPA